LCVRRRGERKSKEHCKQNQADTPHDILLVLPSYRAWEPESNSVFSTCRLLGFFSQPASVHSNNFFAV
jgi:hypothetical protein